MDPTWKRTLHRHDRELVRDGYLLGASLEDGRWFIWSTGVDATLVRQGQDRNPMNAAEAALTEYLR